MADGTIVSPISNTGQRQGGTLLPGGGARGATNGFFSSNPSFDTSLIAAAEPILLAGVPFNPQATSGAGVRINWKYMRWPDQPQPGGGFASGEMDLAVVVNANGGASVQGVKRDDGDEFFYVVDTTNNFIWLCWVGQAGTGIQRFNNIVTTSSTGVTAWTAVGPAPQVLQGAPLQNTPAMLGHIKTTIPPVLWKFSDNTDRVFMRAAEL
jgi:hypothetical protein